MKGLSAIRWNTRKPDRILLSPGIQLRPVIFPDPLAAFLNVLARFELSQEKSGKQVRRQITGSHIHPTIFVYQAAKELVTIGALLANDFRAFDVAGIVNDDAPPSPHVKFLVSWKLCVASAPKVPRCFPL